MGLSSFKRWWSYDSETEKNSADNPVAPLNDKQRRGTGPLLTLAFGWGCRLYEQLVPMLR